MLYPRDGLDDGPDSALSYVLTMGRHELLNLPRVRRLLQMKWDAFGKFHVFRRLMRHLVLLAIFQVPPRLQHPPRARLLLPGTGF